MLLFGSLSPRIRTGPLGGSLPFSAMRSLASFNRLVALSESCLSFVVFVVDLASRSYACCHSRVSFLNGRSFRSAASTNMVSSCVATFVATLRITATCSAWWRTWLIAPVPNKPAASKLRSHLGPRRFGRETHRRWPRYLLQP